MDSNQYMDADAIRALEGYLGGLYETYLAGIYGALRGSNIEVENYSPAKHGSLITYTGIPGYEEVERYWVNSPFAFVTINYDPDESEYLYHVVEPELEDWEVRLLDNLVSDLQDTLIHRRDVGEGHTEAVLETELRELLEEYGVVVEMPTFYKFFYYLDRRFRGFGRLNPVMNDPHVEDISCDGYDIPVFVFHDEYADIKTDIEFDKRELDDFVMRLAQRSGRSISVAEPITDAMLPDGSRGELALGKEVTPHGSAFTIRKYEEDPMTPITLIDYGTFSLDQMAYLWLAIEHNKNLLFAGGTASGKTTSMNAISMFIPPRSKVLTIEDTQEVRLHHENWLSAVTRDNVGDDSDIGMFDLLRSALRHRPEYIIVGEVRGEEAVALFQAMNTGHTTFSTLHADSIQMAINRLENDPIGVPREMVQSLDILSVQRISHVGDERVRRANMISEVTGVDGRSGDLNYMDVFTWDSTGDDFDDRTDQSHVIREIMEERGWSRTELREELRDRKRILRFAQERGVTDYQTFTSIVNEYYAAPGAVLDRIGDEVDDVTVALD